MGLFSNILSSALMVGVGFLMPGAAAFTWGVFFQRVAISTVLSFALSALSPKPAAREQQDNKITNRDPVAARKLIYGTTRVGGTIVYLESTGDSNEYLHLVITLATHELSSIDEVYFNDELVWDGGYQDNWGDVCEITPHLGADDQAADANLVSRITDWTTAHKLSGVAYLYVRLKYDQDKFAAGIPNISAVVNGRKVWTGATTEFSNNPVWCLRDYLLDDTYGMGITEAELNTQAFADAAAVCNEQVTTSTGTQNRYTMDGVVDLSKQRSTIIEEMLTSMGGVFTYSGGEFYIHASKYYAPTYSFSESDITGEIAIQTKQSRRDLYNGVKGVFTSADDNFIAMDYPPIISDAYALEDGDPLYLDINLPYTTDPIRAQRLAKLILLQGRQQISATIPLNLKGLQVKIGDFIQLNNARLGWTNKVFRVTNYELNIDSSGVLGTNLQVIETSASIYDWSTSDETPFVSGLTTNLPAYYDVSVPTNLSTTAGALIQTDGTVLSYIDVSWDNNDAFALSYEIQYRKGSDTFKSVITHNTSYRLENIEAGGSYDIKVRAINRLGARSAFVSGALLGVSDSAAPAVPTSVTAEGGYQAITLRWTNPADYDFRQVEIWEGDDSNSANASLIGYSAGSEFYRANLAINVTKYYFLKSVDYTGNKSAFTTAVSATSDFIDNASFETGVRDLFLDQNLDIIEPVATLPASGDFTGQQVLLTSDGKLYRWDGAAWTLTIADVADNSITGDKIVANTITGGLIAASGIITNTAQINDALITNAKVENGAITNAKISGAIASTNFVTGTSGWEIDKAGDAEFNDVVIRGTIEASTLGTDSLLVKTNGTNFAPFSFASVVNYNGNTTSLTLTFDRVYAPTYSTGFYNYRLASLTTPINVIMAQHGDISTVTATLQVSYDGGSFSDLTSTSGFLDYRGGLAKSYEFTPTGTWGYLDLRWVFSGTRTLHVTSQALVVNGT